MVHKLACNTELVKGLVLDHGARHPDMPKRLENCYILTCNVSLEYEKTEVNSQFFFSNANKRDDMVKTERKFTDERCQKIIDLKKKVTEGNDKSFVVINEKGIDPICL
jgi:T-complex protein 1 subunit zeta